MQYRRAPSTTPQAPVGCTPAIKTGMNSMDNYTTPRLSELLAAHNAGYVLVEAGGKRPIQRNWQRSPVPLAAAWRHAANGGNIGLLGGTGNLIILDADRNAERIEDALPALRSTLKFFRRNAPDRAKWIVRVDGGDLPASRKAAALEILAAGRQAVIVGRHESGAMLEHTGTAIVALKPAELETLWERVTGSPHSARPALQASPARTETALPSPARTEAAQTSMARAEAMVAALGIGRGAWRAKPDGWLLELESCPFVAVGAEPGRQHSVPRKSFVRVAADGTLGAGCQSTRCQHAIEASGTSGWRLLSSLAGERQPGTDVAGVIARLRHFVRRADLSAHVPSHLQAANGYRTRDTDVAVADAILDIAEERGRIDRLPLGLRDVRARAGLGSVSTAAAAIARLDGWLLTRVEREGKRAFDADLYTLVTPSAAHVAYIEHSISNSTTILPEYEQQCSIYATSPLRTHRADDAFSMALTNITEAELDRRCAERDALIAAGAELRPIRRSRYWRRLQAALPCAGRGVLRLLDALAEDGGVCSRARLRVLLNIKTATLSRLVARAHLLGLVAADRQQVSLNSDWQATIDAIRQHMPSAGRLDAIAEREDNERLAWLQKASRRPDLSRAEATRLHRSIERTAARRQMRAQEERPDLTVRHADVPSTTAGQLAVMARLAERTAVAHLDAAEARNAGQWRLVREIGTLRRDGVSRRQTRRYLELAGWERREVYSALASAWPVAQEAV